MENQLTLGSLNLWSNEFSFLLFCPLVDPLVGTHLGSPQAFTKPSVYDNTDINLSLLCL